MKRTSTLVPQLRFKEFESADPWEVKKLGEVLENQSIKNKSQEDLTVLSVSNSLGFISQMEQFENREVASKDKSNYKIVLKNDYAYNPSRINVGSIARLINFEKGIVSPMYIVFRLKGLDNRFFDQLLNTFLFKELVKANLSGGVRDSLSFDALITFSTPLPTIAEQEKIAAVLCSMDRLLELETQKLQHLEEHKKGLLQKLFPAEGQTVPQLRFKEFESADPWEVKKLGEVVQTIKTGKLDANAMEVKGKYRFYTCAKEYYRINTYAFNTEALLISGNGANVGYIHYYKGKFNAYQRTYVLSDIMENIFYIKYFLDLNLPNRIQIEKKEGNTPYIVLSTLTEMQILLPRLAEQEKIATVLSSADQHITQQKQKVQALKQQKQYLLQNLFPQEVE